jgi:hypothetical protein
MIGISHDNHVAHGLTMSPSLGPEIKHVVQVNVGKAATSAVPKPELKGRNLASLQRGLFLRLPGVGISASSLALDLKSKARTLRISWSNAMPVAPSRA